MFIPCLMYISLLIYMKEHALSFKFVSHEVALHCNICGAGVTKPR